MAEPKQRPEMPCIALKQHIQEKYLYPLLLALILLNIAASLIAAASLHYFTTARNTVHVLTMTNTRLADVYSSLRDAESGQRGYVITGNSSYLSPYYEGTRDAQMYIAQLKPQYVGGSHAAELAKLIQLTKEKQSEMAETLNLRMTQGLNAAIALVDTNQGANIMNNIQRLLLTMESQETSSTTQRDHNATIFATVAYTSLAGSFIFTLILVYFVRLVFQQIKQQSEHLEVLNTELMRSNRELQDFASIASHDLQEPLRKIQAFGDRLAKSASLSEDSTLYLDRMLSAASRMRILIDDLLAYSRVTTKAKPFTRVSLKRIVKEVISDMEVRVEETDTSISVGRLPAIDADAVQIRQIFQNLISNAIKFCEPGTKPKIAIRSTMDTVNDRSMVHISVTDNGIGFDQKYTDRIFTIFQRLHGRNEYEGTGIGLAVVRKIAERHGGSVAAVSEVGKGSQFIVTLPVVHKKT